MATATKPKTEEKRKRTKIDATPILEEVAEVPEVRKVQASKLYDDLVTSILTAKKPGTWFKVFTDLPSSSAANTRAASIKGYENMEATSRNSGEDSYDVYARAVASK